MEKMKMTSAYANKMLKKWAEDKEFYRNKEQKECNYVCAQDEEPVIPEYDYTEVSGIIRSIDKKVSCIKHAINVNNCTNVINIDMEELTIDQILIQLAQLNQRKAVLDAMRKQQPKTRINSGVYAARKPVPEYQYINYDLEQVKKEYEEITLKIASMQIALDKYNQTFEFEVEI